MMRWRSWPQPGEEGLPADRGGTARNGPAVLVPGWPENLWAASKMAMQIGFPRWESIRRMSGRASAAIGVGASAAYPAGSRTTVRQ